ncbi:hypothetical protein Phum_PHUM149740 [Pediculus humanus corporis]|uniref:Uncharacterized protein n=1 Tax=Pediculus humanus subsp. corporis TaxID=121224 RepID=E0VF63_PEDHC|nr:uncharacterized protein Phum_PHUM149740 [Pediculus humanus corporis]EEB12019.1 hypothetical protein Phum_PHUM149740 [Pediculus humanus corporis]
MMITWQFGQHQDDAQCETHRAMCMSCGKTFKGQRPNTICERHLKQMHPEFYKILLEKKIKRAELHMSTMVKNQSMSSSFNHR